MKLKDCVWNKDIWCRWDHLCRVVPHCLGMKGKTVEMRDWLDG